MPKAVGKLLAGVLCLALPGWVDADLFNTASVTYRDGAGHLLSGQSNTVQTAIAGTAAPPTAPAAPDLRSLDGKTFSPTDTIVLPYTDAATTFVWEFDAVNGEASALVVPVAATSAQASLSTLSPRLSLSLLTLPGGAYTMRIQAINNGLASAWSSARITWVSAVDLSAIKVYPNPWRASRGDAPIRFTQMPLESTVKIFTVSGRAVKTLSAPAGDVTWDLTNDSGEKVASGLYLYVVTDRADHPVRGKLGVIR